MLLTDLTYFAEISAKYNIKWENLHIAADKHQRNREIPLSQDIAHIF